MSNESRDDIAHERLIEKAETARDVERGDLLINRLFDFDDPVRTIHRALKNLPRVYKGGKSTLYWVAVRELFGYGSTTSIQICRHFGINPHSELQDHP